MVLIYDVGVGSSGCREVPWAEWTVRGGFECCLDRVVTESALGRTVKQSPGWNEGGTWLLLEKNFPKEIV